jgi:RNA polymerase sigma-70 factor (ECF subfamily)
VLQAGENNSAGAEVALEKLCATYWPPLYNYVRRSGYNKSDAEDLTQAFFARFIAKNYLSAARRERGRFRSFLLTCLQHFLTQEWRKARRTKRGGEQSFIAWDLDAAEEEYTALDTHNLTPAEVYDERWALTLFERALNRLREEFHAQGKGSEYERLKHFLSNESSGGAYEKPALDLGLTTGAAAVFVHRLRKRYGELVREEIAHTVTRPEEVSGELNYLLSLVGR